MPPAFSLFARTATAVALIGSLFTACSQPSEENAVSAQDRELAKQILADESLTDVLERAQAIVRTGFNAGDGYGEVWIRDLATFIELACDVHDPKTIRENLLMFFRFQGDDGNIIDGFIPADKGNVSYDYIRKDSIPGFLGHKNTVETDQESSLVHAVYKYVRKTNDRSILAVVVDGKTVKERLTFAMEYLFQDRFAEKYGLLWGATTADWGDVQPEHDWGVVIDENSHLAIDIYDNAMFLVALANIIELFGDDEELVATWSGVRQEVHDNVREHLWDEERGKFVPHIYLDGSPFPADFDESAIYYHGGTAVAIEAGLLTPDEIELSLKAMAANVEESGAPTIGLTVYPPYPAGFFKNPSMAKPYSYQNGGDWTWFGGRMIQQLVRTGFVEEAYRELRPMIARVQKHEGFYEWWQRDGKPAGSGTFRGSAGVLAKAIEMLHEWAEGVVESKPSSGDA